MVVNAANIRFTGVLRRNVVRVELLIEPGQRPVKCVAEFMNEDVLCVARRALEIKQILFAAAHRPAP